MFLPFEHFILFHSGGLSKVSYLVPYLWFLCYCSCLAMDEAFWDVQKAEMGLGNCEKGGRYCRGPGFPSSST